MMNATSVLWILSIGRMCLYVVGVLTVANAGGIWMHGGACLAITVGAAVGYCLRRFLQSSHFVSCSALVCLGTLASVSHCFLPIHETRFLIIANSADLGAMLFYAFTVSLPPLNTASRVRVMVASCAALGVAATGSKLGGCPANTAMTLLGGVAMLSAEWVSTHGQSDTASTTPLISSTTRSASFCSRVRVSILALATMAVWCQIRLASYVLGDVTEVCMIGAGVGSVVALLLLDRLLGRKLDTCPAPYLAQLTVCALGVVFSSLCPTNARHVVGFLCSAGATSIGVIAVASLSHRESISAKLAVLAAPPMWSFLPEVFLQLLHVQSNATATVAVFGVLIFIPIVLALFMTKFQVLDVADISSTEVAHGRAEVQHNITRSASPVPHDASIIVNRESTSRGPSDASREGSSDTVAAATEPGLPHIIISAAPHRHGTPSPNPPRKGSQENDGMDDNNNALGFFHAQYSPTTTPSQSREDQCTTSQSKSGREPSRASSDHGDEFNVSWWWPFSSRKNEDDE